MSLSLRYENEGFFGAVDTVAVQLTRSLRNRSSLQDT